MQQFLVKNTVILQLLIILYHWNIWSRDPSEIILICWFAAPETFIIVENNAAAYVFGNHYYFIIPNLNDFLSFVELKYILKTTHNKGDHKRRSYHTYLLKGVLLCSFTKSWFCFGGVLEHAWSEKLIFHIIYIIQHLFPQPDTND